MMAAVLETAGYIYQDHMLTDLEKAMGGLLGGFIFLIGIVIALTHTAVRGSFKLAPWLLIGPPMFFAAVLPRTQIDEVQWRFGQQARNQSKVSSRVTVMTGKGAANVRVSKLFERYVRL